MVVKRSWILALAILGCDRGSPPSPRPAVRVPAPITLFAASSVKELAIAIGTDWTTKTGQVVRLQFEASSTLARQIQAGAPADLFISAAPEWLDALKTVDRVDWLSNRLVVVVRKEVASFDLAKAESLALANEQVPAGKYAQAALRHLGIPLPSRTLYGANVRDVLSKVSQGGAQAGIVYSTDAALDPELRVAFTFPPESYPRILYSVGLLSAPARPLYEALREPWAIRIATRQGFVELK